MMMGLEQCPHCNVDPKYIGFKEFGDGIHFEPAVIKCPNCGRKVSLGIDDIKRLMEKHNYNGYFLRNMKLWRALIDETCDLWNNTINAEKTMNNEVEE